MARLRILILILAAWLSLIFNLERPDLFGINLSPVVYFLVVALTVLLLLFPDLGATRVELVIGAALSFYVLSPHLGFLANTRISPFMTVTEIAIIIMTVFTVRILSRSVANVEQVVESVVVGAGETRILSTTEGEQTANNELFRARRFNRPVSLVVIKTSSVADLQANPFDRFSYQSVLQQRYIRNRIGQIAESVLYHGDPVAWNGDDLVICLPETNAQEAQKVIKQIAELIHITLHIEPAMGNATFPEDGLIYRDLVEVASNRATNMYGDNDGMKTDSRVRPPDETSTTPRSISAALNTTTAKPSLQRVLRFIQHGAEILPPMKPLKINWSEETPYYNPDFWVNRLPYQSIGTRTLYRRLKRLVDGALVVVTLPLTLPIGLLIAGAIMVTDGAPVLYVQQRTGMGGRKFKMYKFRTMIRNAEQRLQELNVRVNERGETINEHGEKLEDDPRITRIGKLLRKTSLDELPQLWNVLVGEMSIVGPRPTSFGVDKYALLHTQRLSVKPGITGLWQIYDRGDTNFDNRLIWDIKYIDKLSLSLDLQILVRTVLKVAGDRGAR